MNKLADLAPAALGLMMFPVIPSAFALYETLTTTQFVVLVVWILASFVTSYRYVKLDVAAEHRGFNWMTDRLTEASRERTRRIMAGEDPSA